MLARPDTNPFATVKHNIGQRIGQVASEVVTSVAPIAFFSQFTGVVGNDPFSPVVYFFSGPLNYLSGKVIGSLVSQQNPFSEFKAAGFGNSCRGFLVEGGKVVITGGMVMGAAYGVGTLMSSYGNEFAVKVAADGSANVLLKAFSTLLQDPALLAPTLGAVGFGTYRGIMKLWDTCVPFEHEVDIVRNHSQLYLVQILGQYASRLLMDLILTETTLYYMWHYGEETLTTDFRFQAGIFLTLDALMKVTSYFVHTLHPLGSLVDPIDAQKRIVIDEEMLEELDALIEHPPKANMCRETTLAAAKATGKYALFCGAAYGSALMVCYLGPECVVTGIIDQAKDIAMAMAPALVADFAVRDVFPRVKSWCGFFQRSNKESLPAIRSTEEEADFINQYSRGSLPL